MENTQVVSNKNSKKPQKGASMVEYALLVGLIAVVALVTVRLLGQSVCGQFSSVVSALSGTN